MESPSQREDLDGQRLAEVLAAAAEGDDGAWRLVLAAYAPRVFALARSRCGRSDAAEEITQSVFVTIAAKLSAGEYREEGRFESWLFRVTMNRIRDEIRRVRRHAEPAEPEAVMAALPPWLDAAGDDGSVACLRSALDALSDADREVIELRHHAGLGFRQMADLLDEPVGTLLARHHRALRKLRELMSPSPDSDKMLEE